LLYNALYYHPSKEIIICSAETLLFSQENSLQNKLAASLSQAFLKFGEEGRRRNHLLNLKAEKRQIVEGEPSRTHLIGTGKQCWLTWQLTDLL